MAVDSTGLKIQRYPEVLKSITDAQDASILAPLNHNESSFIYNLSTIFALQVAKVQQLAQEVYNSSRISTAEGRNLDNLVALRKVRRLEAAPSFTELQKFTGDNGTVINIGSQFQNPSSKTKVITTSIINVSNLACYSITFSVDVVANSTAYTLTLDGTTYTYTTAASGTITKTIVIDGLYALISVASPFTYLLKDKTSTTLTISINPSQSAVTAFKAVAISFLKTDSVSVVGYCETIEKGGLSLPIGTVTSIISPITGLKTTTNLADYTVGRLLETDEELRIRTAATTNAEFGCTELNIESALRNNVAGVTSCNVIQNDTMTTVGSIPPKSYEVIVTGGTDEDVAQEIWRTKPAGCSSLYGTSSESIVDSSGATRTIAFTRPAQIDLAVRVTYSLYAEEDLTTSVEDVIQSVVVDYITSLGNGVDVIPSRMIGLIYAATTGLDGVLVEVKPLASGSFSTTRFSIVEAEYASTTISDVTFP